MREDARALYRKAFNAFSELNAPLDDAQKVAAGDISLNELSDYIYATREACKLLEGLSKKAKQLLEGQKRILCMRWVLSNPTGVNIKTPHTTVTPKISIMPTLPSKKKDPEGYVAFMKFYGFTDQEIECDSFRPHWPGMKQQIADDSEAGRPMPPGCDPSRNYSVYDALVLAKKGVLEE